MTSQRNIIIQTIVLVIIASIFLYFFVNVKAHLRAEDIPSGFAFLHKASGFDVIMDLIPFTTASTNLRAFYVGILNTLLLSVVAIFFSTVIGICIATMCLSKNWLLCKLSDAYIEFFRNIPLLLQIFFWYFILLNYMPQTNNSTIFGNIAFNVQGITFGKIILIPEFLAMLLGLALYAAGHIAQHILNGIATVDRGQLEAAMVSRLTPWQRFKLIIFPQAIRNMLPPIVQQYLTTFKSTALGAAVGYPDLVAIFAGTVLTQTGQAVETIFMTMSFYLLVDMLVAYLINIYQIKTKLPGK